MTGVGKLLLKSRTQVSTSAEILKEHGLTVLAFLVLDLMCGTDDPELINDVSQAEVARDLQMMTKDANRNLLKLESDDLVERVISIGKRPRFGPSPKGEKVYREALRKLTG